MKALAECRCWSLTPDAEDVIVVLLAVLLHYAEHLTFALGHRVVGRGGFQQVEDDDRAVSKRSRSVAFQGGLVGVDGPAG